MGRAKPKAVSRQPPQAPRLPPALRRLAQQRPRFQEPLYRALLWWLRERRRADQPLPPGEAQKGRYMAHSLGQPDPLDPPDSEPMGF